MGKGLGATVVSPVQDLENFCSYLVSEKHVSRSIILVFKFLRYRWHGYYDGLGGDAPFQDRNIFHLLSKIICGMCDLRKMIPVKSTTSLAIVTEARIFSIHLNVRASEASERFRNSFFFQFKV